MSHDLMRQAAKRALNDVTRSQSDLASLVAQLDADRPNYFRVTELLLAVGAAYAHGFVELNKVAASYEMLIEDWKRNGAPDEPHGTLLA